MKLAAKLLLPLLITASVALGAVALSTLSSHRTAKAAQEHFESDLASVRRAAEAQQQLAETHANVYRTQAIIDSMNPAALKAFRSGLADKLKAVQASVAALAAEAGGDEQMGVGVGAAAALIDKYRGQADKAIELTSVEINMGVAAMKAAEASFGELNQALQKVLDRKEAMRQEHMAKAQQQALWATLALVGLAGLATVAALGFAWVTQQRIVREVKRAADLGAQVAAGNLQADAAVAGDPKNDDEVGALLRSLSGMVVQLRETLQTVRQASDSIRTASQEIASGNLDLSQRTEQSASSLQQTASSMEQLTGTVGQTAEAARSAHQLAGSASSVAQRGGAVVAQVVDTMQEINQRSRKIADIIGTIDGIAFQTNILALNAAVEAARAGEQGRGFAVVASEVRSLAQRSAAAAREIKTLIQSSVEGVETGSKQVQEAGSTMSEIVASVQRVSDIIGEISAAAAEQSSGIGQVNQSVNQLDQSTQQNAALVEQSAAAAESLKEQAARLTGVVSRFQLGGAGDVGDAPPAPVPVAAPHAAPTPAAQAAATVQRARVGSPLTSPKTAKPAPKGAPAPRARPAPAAAPAAADGDDWQSF